MENEICYNYTLGDSPASDRLVINLDDKPETVETTYPQATQRTNPSPVSSQDSSFSMSRLLGDSETSNQHDFRHQQTMEQLLPRIHDAFDLYSSTSITDSLSRIFDLGNPFQQLTGQELPHLPTDNPDTATDLTHKPKVNKDTHKKNAAVCPMLLEKPPYTYVGLIIVAMDSSPQKMLNLADVRSKLQSWFPFFNGPYTGWKSSLRHTVSKHCCFYKVRPDEGSRGYLWAVKYENVRPTLLVRQNRSTYTDDLFTQYKYNLHEQVGVPAVQYPAQDDRPGRKQSGLKLPSKPCYEHSHNILSTTTNELICGRNDDALSQNGDSTTIFHHCSGQKRKADIPDHETQQDNLKRKKTLAVNPTPNNESSNPTPTVESTLQITDEKAIKTPVQQNQYFTSEPSTSDYQAESANGTHPAHVNYHPQQWPYLYDTIGYYPTVTSHYNNFSNYQHYNYQHYNNYGYLYQQQPVIQSYQTWPYYTPQTHGQDCYNYSGYWNQLVDPTSVPVNLSKQSDNCFQ